MERNQGPRRGQGDRRSESNAAGIYQQIPCGSKDSPIYGIEPFGVLTLGWLLRIFVCLDCKYRQGDHDKSGENIVEDHLVEVRL